MLTTIIALCLTVANNDTETNRIAYMIPNKLENCHVTINLDEYYPMVDVRYNVNWNNVTFTFTYSKPYTFNLYQLLEILSKNKNNKINRCIFNYKRNGFK